MLRHVLLLLLALAWVPWIVGGSLLKLESDGGYSGLVIKIADDGSVPEDKCPQILDNIKVGKRFVCVYQC